MDVPTFWSSLFPVPPVSYSSSSPEPPAPLTPPRLLAKQSRQLVVSPVDCFSGDGPIVSIKLFYKPKDDTSAWSSIVGMCLPGERGPRQERTAVPSSGDLGWEEVSILGPIQ